MPTSNTTLDAAVLHIAEQLTGLIECREALVAANSVETLDLALRAIADSSGVLRVSASSLRFSAGLQRIEGAAAGGLPYEGAP